MIVEPNEKMYNEDSEKYEHCSQDVACVENMREMHHVGRVVSSDVFI